MSSSQIISKYDLVLPHSVSNKIRVAVALEGGGAKGGYGWGVLDGILGDPRLEIAVIMGTSIGALQGDAVARGIAEGKALGLDNPNLHARECLDLLLSTSLPQYQKEQFGKTLTDPVTSPFALASKIFADACNHSIPSSFLSSATVRHAFETTARLITNVFSTWQAIASHSAMLPLSIQLPPGIREGTQPLVELAAEYCLPFASNFVADFLRWAEPTSDGNAIPLTHEDVTFMVTATEKELGRRLQDLGASNSVTFILNGMTRAEQREIIALSAHINVHAPSPHKGSYFIDGGLTRMDSEKFIEEARKKNCELVLVLRTIPNDVRRPHATFPGSLDWMREHSGHMMDGALVELETLAHAANMEFATFEPDAEDYKSLALANDGTILGMGLGPEGHFDEDRMKKLRAAGHAVFVEEIDKTMAKIIGAPASRSSMATPVAAERAPAPAAALA